MERCQEERDRLARQNSTETAVQNSGNLKDLTLYDQCSDVDELREAVKGLQKLLDMKTTESGMMAQEIQDLQNELEVRKFEVCLHVIVALTL